MSGFWIMPPRISMTSGVFRKPSLSLLLYPIRPWRNSKRQRSWPGGHFRRGNPERPEPGIRGIPESPAGGFGGGPGIFPMCQADPPSQARAMNTNTVNSEPSTDSADRTALRRPYAGRMVAGVAEGLARYLGVDATLVRIAFVVLTIAGGAGIPLYLAGLLLIPGEGSEQSIAGALIESLRSGSR
jgi:phage shock protein PspC (stress-responsive transcriptional regulator)